MLAAPSVVGRVLRPILSPVAARVGDVLTFWPGHPLLTFCVFSSDLRHLRSSMHRPDDVAYAELLDLFLDAKVSLPEDSQRALLTRTT